MNLLELVKRLDELHGKATPGEWRVEGPDCFMDYNIMPDNDTTGALAGVVNNGRPPEEVRANAHLIPALVNAWPQLSAALQARQTPDQPIAQEPQQEEVRVWSEARSCYIYERRASVDAQGASAVSGDVHEGPDVPDGYWPKLAARMSGEEAKQARRDALEEAAKVCEAHAARADAPDAVDPDRFSPEWDEAYWQCGASMRVCAAAIRALRDAAIDAERSRADSQGGRPEYGGACGGLHKRIRLT